MRLAYIPMHKTLKISYIVPDFDENAYSSGLYVIFQHCNGMMERGQMMGGMMEMSNQMSTTMGKMSGMMKDMPAGNMKKLFNHFFINKFDGNLRNVTSGIDVEYRHCKHIAHSNNRC